MGRGVALDPALPPAPKQKLGLLSVTGVVKLPQYNVSVFRTEDLLVDATPEFNAAFTPKLPQVSSNISTLTNIRSAFGANAA